MKLNKEDVGHGLAAIGLAFPYSLHQSQTFGFLVTQSSINYKMHLNLTISTISQDNKSVGVVCYSRIIYASVFIPIYRLRKSRRGFDLHEQSIKDKLPC